MRKTTWFLFLGYFLVFAGIGIFIYFRYSQKLFSGAEALPVETAAQDEQIYYSQENNLYKVSPNLTFEPQSAERIARFQSTGEVQNLDVSPNKQKIAYDSRSSDGFWKVWQVEKATNTSLEIASQGRESLEDYQNFTRPKYSPDGTFLAFLGQKDQSDALFLDNLATGSITKLSIQIVSKITDYSWDKTSSKIIFCTSNLLTNSCGVTERISGGFKKVLEGDISQISWVASEIIYLKKEDQMANIFRSKEDGSEPLPISYLKSPKSVINFQIDSTGQNIVYEVSDNNNPNIYFSKIDGTNIIQLTADAHSYDPHFSPEGNEIAFVRPQNGIYSIKTNKTAENKIVNLEEAVRLLLWR